MMQLPSRRTAAHDPGQFHGNRIAHDLDRERIFDRCFTSQLVELGREDARAQSDETLALLGQ